MREERANVFCLHPGLERQRIVLFLVGRHADPAVKGGAASLGVRGAARGGRQRRRQQVEAARRRGVWEFAWIRRAARHGYGVAMRQGERPVGGGHGFQVDRPAPCKHLLLPRRVEHAGWDEVRSVALRKDVRPAWRVGNVERDLPLRRRRRAECVGTALEHELRRIRAGKPDFLEPRAGKGALADRQRDALGTCAEDNVAEVVASYERLLADALERPFRAQQHGAQVARILAGVGIRDGLQGGQVECAGSRPRLQ